MSALLGLVCSMTIRDNPTPGVPQQPGTRGLVYRWRAAKVHEARYHRSPRSRVRDQPGVGVHLSHTLTRPLEVATHPGSALMELLSATLEERTGALPRWCPG